MGRFRKLGAASFGAALVGSLLFAATAGAAEQETDVKSITIHLIPSPSADSIKKSIPDFTKATGIDVQVVETPYDSAHQKELLSIRSGQGNYDVVQFDNGYLAPFVSQGALVPLDSYLSSSAAYDISDFAPALQDYGKVDGKTYGLDLSTEPMIMFYRKDLYDNLGLKAPDNLDDYLKNAEKIQAAGKASGQILPLNNPFASAPWIQILWNFGGDVFDANMKPTVNTPQAKQAAEYLVKLAKLSPNAALSSDDDGSVSMFTSTDIGQTLDFSGYYSQLEDPQQSKVAGKLAYAPVPGQARSLSMLQGWNIGIASDSRKQAAAWRFLEFTLGKARAKQFLLSGAAAIGRTSIVTDPDLVKQFPYLATLVPAAEHGRRLPVLTNWEEVRYAIGSNMANIISGQSSVDDGLSAMQSQIETLMAAHK